MTKIDHDHFPEITENAGGTRRAEILGVKEQLRDTEERRRLFATMSDEQFQRMLGYVNSVTRGEKISYDYADGVLPAMATPSEAEKEPLMKMAFEAVRNIVTDSDLEDHAALRRAALTMAGAVNLIHPYEDGNGRTGRVVHYLVEYGTERGDEAFNEELYAIIAKLKVYDTDNKVALYDTPPNEVVMGIDAYVDATQSDVSSREKASSRVAVFLDMMQGNTEVPVVKKKRTASLEEVVPGYVDGAAAYEKTYETFSEIPHRKPNQRPPHAQRVIAEKAQKETFSPMTLDVL